MMHSLDSADLIVVGGGHAGLEAAWAASALGVDTLLLTMSLDTIGKMSCNPAIGGLGKGHLVVELDALGGLMPLLIDRCGIQFKILNRSRGPAVQAPRAQADKMLYQHTAHHMMESRPHLRLRQGQATGLWMEGGRLKGLEVDRTYRVACKALVLTTGTFLQGLIHQGPQTQESGRAGEPAARGLSQALQETGHILGRMKTGTPPRVDGRTINFEVMTEQPGENPPLPFSIATDRIEQPQISCHITATTLETRQIIQDNIEQSPLYSGQIDSIGPRYCPSIEDKVVKFPDNPTHNIFVEPEGLNTHEVYLNGLSTSLPPHIQTPVVQSIPGLEKAQILRFGYAIEYDFVHPTDLGVDLQSRRLPGLYMAGQINGTTGYEEAAALGYWAGTNAALGILGRDMFHVERTKAYMGVLVEDLITKGVTEPYRLFTSRAEHRLLLGTDSAYARLAPLGEKTGTLDDLRRKRIAARESGYRAALDRAVKIRIKPGDEKGQALQAAGKGLRDGLLLSELLKRADLDENLVYKLCQPELEVEHLPRLRGHFRYQGYVARAEKDANRLAAHLDHPIPVDLDFSQVPGLRKEAVEILSERRPATIRLASQIPGITPAACNLLAVLLERKS